MYALSTKIFFIKHHFLINFTEIIKFFHILFQPTPAMLALMAKKAEEDDSAKNSLQTSSEESTIVGLPQHNYPPNKTFSYTKIITMNTNESYGKPPQ